jgi:hypothetical protein
VPFVCPDGVESQALRPLARQLACQQASARQERQTSRTSRTSSSLMAPGTSLLFLKTSRLAPERR